MMLRHALKVTCVLCATTLAGCYDPLDREAVIGLYVANHDQGDERLVLYEDGTYRLRYIFQGKLIVDNSGTWEYPVFESTVRLGFEGYVFGYDGLEKPSRVPGFWAPEVERTLSGGLFLRVNPDLAISYVKVP